MKTLALILAVSTSAAPQEGAPPAEAPPAAQPAAPAPAGETQDHEAQLDSFNRRLADIEGKIMIAKEKVDLLRDTMLGGTIARSRALIIHRNEMGGSFVLEKAVYMLDGGIIFAKENVDGSLDANKEIEVYNGPINPGTHELTVSLVFTGSSRGLFTYVKGYKFKVESKKPYSFVVPDGRMATLSVVSYSKGDITTATTDRLAVRYDLEVGNVPSTLGVGGEAQKPAENPPPAKTP